MHSVNCSPPYLKALGAAGVIFSAGFLIGHLASAREAAPSASPDAKTILTATHSVVGEPLRYPVTAPAEITAKVITLAPGQVTSWHTHPMPTFGYILEGEIVVNYGAKGHKTFRQGTALMEAMAHVHRGENRSEKPVRVLAVSLGAQGLPAAVKADK